jgi:hypothetical protein
MGGLAVVGFWLHAHESGGRELAPTSRRGSHAPKGDQEAVPTVMAPVGLKVTLATNGPRTGQPSTMFFTFSAQV